MPGHSSDEREQYGIPLATEVLDALGYANSSLAEGRIQQKEGIIYFNSLPIRAYFHARIPFVSWLALQSDETFQEKKVDYKTITGEEAFLCQLSYTTASAEFLSPITKEMLQEAAQGLTGEVSETLVADETLFYMIDILAYEFIEYRINVHSVEVQSTDYFHENAETITETLTHQNYFDKYNDRNSPIIAYLRVNELVASEGAMGHIYKEAAPVENYFKYRPGYGTTEMLIEFTKGTDDQFFPVKVLKALESLHPDLGGTSLLLLCHQEEFDLEVKSDCGDFTFNKDPYNFYFLFAENNQIGLQRIEATLSSNGFIREEVDFEKYKHTEEDGSEESEVAAEIIPKTEENKPVPEVDLEPIPDEIPEAKKIWNYETDSSRPPEGKSSRFVEQTKTVVVTALAIAGASYYNIVHDVEATSGWYFFFLLIALFFAFATSVGIHKPTGVIVLLWAAVTIASFFLLFNSTFRMKLDYRSAELHQHGKYCKGVVIDSYKKRRPRYTLGEWAIIKYQVNHVQYTTELRNNDHKYKKGDSLLLHYSSLRPDLFRINKVISSAHP